MIKSTNDSVMTHSEESFHPDYVNLDDRSIEELMYSFREYAKQIPFVDDSGNHLGQWSEMYDHELLFLLVDISLIDIGRIDDIKKNLLNMWNNRGEAKSTHFIYSVLGILKKLYKKASKLEATWVITEINAVVKDSLFHSFEQFKNSAQPKKNENKYDDIIVWYDRLFDTLNLQNNSDIYIKDAKVNKLFKDIIDDALNCLLIIQNKSINTIYEDVLIQGNHSAHIGLLYGFLKSYESIQKQLNLLPNRHINYYYKTILKQKPLNASPDFLYVFMSLIPVVDLKIIEKGTLFSAGQDSLGDNIIFEANNNIALTQAKITEIKTLLFNKNQKILPLEEGNMVTGIYMDTIGLDQIGKKLYDNKSWSLFDSEDRQYNEQNREPEFGWAIASPVFYLTAGQRKVTLTYRLTNLTGFIRTMDALMDSDERAISISKVEMFHLFLKNAFDIQISSSEGWVTIENYMVAFEDTFDETSNALIFQFTLPPSFPAWVPNQNPLHGNKYSTDLPIVTFKLKQVSVYYPYTLLEKLKIKTLDIEVDVKHFNNLFVYNKHGLIDISQAAPILGMNPLHKNQFQVGAIEWQSKNLRFLKCRIKWMDLPKPNFQSYYKDYLSYQLVDDSFIIEFNDHTSKKRCEQLFCLKNGLLEDESRFVFDDIKKSAGKEVVSESDLFNPKNSPLGFVSFKLIAPDIGFGSAIYTNEMGLYGQKMMTNSKFKKTALPPNKPFIPYASSIEVDYKSTHHIAFENKSSGGKNETFDFFHIHPHGISKEGDDKTIKNNSIIPNEYGDKGYLYIGLENVKPFMEISIFLKIVPSIEPRIKENLLNIDYLSGEIWEPFGTDVVENSTYEGQESGIIRLFFPLDLSSNHPFFDKNKHWIRLSVDSADIKYIGKCNYINTNVGLLKRKLPNEDSSFKTLSPNAIASLVSKNEAIQSIEQPFYSFGGKDKEEEKKFYARVSNRLGHKNRMVRPRDYKRMIMEKFSEVNWLKVLTASEYNKKWMSDFVDVGEIRIIVMPKIKITGDRSTFYVRKKTQREIEHYVKQCCAPTINVKVESPEYEEIEVRCRLVRRNPNHYIPYHEISNIIKRQIAPWLFYEKASLKHLNTSFSVGNLVYALSQHPNVKEVPWCQVIHLSEDTLHPKSDKVYHYNFTDSYTDGDIIEPSSGKAILIPATEFKIYQTDKSDPKIGANDEVVMLKNETAIFQKLNVGCMDIGQTFILSKEESTIKMPKTKKKKVKSSKASIKKYFINFKQIIKS